MNSSLFLASEKCCIRLDYLLVFGKQVKYVRGYPAYITIWEPKDGEFLETRLEPENELDKYAVEAIKKSVAVGQLAKGKTGRFSFFLRC